MLDGSASPTGMLGAGGQDRGDEQSAIEAASDMGRGVGAILATGVSRPGAQPLCSSRAIS
jgi:hypothetical protein